MQRIIGIAGYAQAGKDSVAGFVNPTHHLKFADGVRLLLDRLDPPLYTADGGPYLWSDALRNLGYENTKARTDARDWMVRLGAGAREVLGPDVWVRRVEDAIHECADPDAVIVISDVRYMSEVSMIHRRGGTVALVSRTNYGPANQEEERTIAELAPHADHHIINDGTMEDLMIETMNTLKVTA